MPRGRRCPLLRFPPLSCRAARAPVFLVAEAGIEIPVDPDGSPARPRGPAPARPVRALAGAQPPARFTRRRGRGAGDVGALLRASAAGGARPPTVAARGG